MSGVEAAAADRLPWLADEPAPKGPSRRRQALGWSAAAILLVAVIAFLFGIRSVETEAPPARLRHPASATVRLPEPRAQELPQVRLPSQPQVQPSRPPQVQPTPVREIHVSPLREPRTVRPQHSDVKTADARTVSPVKAVSPTKPAAPTIIVPAPWNPRDVEGARGRIVEIGAFGSTRQAKGGWWYMVRAYPALAHLPAVVRTSQNSKGKIFYRFQIGTTSQAHSEILCQRMQRISLSCAVVGLPWKAKVER